MILFETGSVNIDINSSQLLSSLATTLRQCPEAKITILGHTDDVGNDELNLKLIESRAQSVMATLIGTGVRPDRISAIGYASTLPIDSNDTEQGRQKTIALSSNLSSKKAEAQA